MKKSLIALAALATVATAAQAQSSVTIYGIMDMGISSVSKVSASNASNSGSAVTSTATGTVTGLSNGGLSTSRFGFRGNEDLGGGLTAGFTLEGEILGDIGAQGNTATDLFHRGAFITLSQANVGSVRMGRINREDYSLGVKYDAFGGNNIGGWIASSNQGTVDLDTNVRVNSAVELKTASIGGLVLTYQHGFGETAGDATLSRTTVLAADYTQGKFGAAAVYTRLGGSTSSAADVKTTGFFASYDFTVAKLLGGYTQKETVGTAAKPTGYFVGAQVPVNAKVGLLAQYNAFDNDAGKKPSVYTLGATYAFSKRTTGYVLGAKSSQDNGSSQEMLSSSKYYNFYSNAAGANQTAVSVGVRHTF